MSIFNWDTIYFLLTGLKVTVEVAVLSIIFSFLFGSILGIFRFSKIFLFSKILGMIVDVIRNLPLLLIIFFTYFALPQILGVRLNIFWSAVLALTIFESAMFSEIVRAGLNAVPKGQMEAGLSTGLSSFSTLRIILIPQAYKMMIPAMVSQFISLIKDTSLAVIISLPEFTHQAQIVYSQDSRAVLPMFSLLAIGYFAICFALSQLARFIEKRGLYNYSA